MDEVFSKLLTQLDPNIDVGAFGKSAREAQLEGQVAQLREAGLELEARDVLTAGEGRSFWLVDVEALASVTVLLKWGALEDAEGRGVTTESGVELRASLER
jgi:hypothetical protein